jgi:major membrane immunogen (membrane-anchored lipoprotein)
MQTRILTFIFIISLLFTSCTKEDIISPCLTGDCKQSFWIDTLSNKGSFKDGYWRVKYQGLGYFTIKGESHVQKEYPTSFIIPISNKSSPK